MALWKSVKQLGDLRIYDMRSTINLSRVRPEFFKLEADPYLKDGYRHKRILWMKHEKQENFSIQKKNVLYQSKMHNPTHGGIQRIYPTIDTWRHDPKIIQRIMAVFANTVSVPVGAELLMQFQRITTPGKPSVENWHRDGVNKLGVLCVARENVVGGMSEFKNDTSFFRCELPPGYLLVCNDSEVLHRVTDIESKHEDYPGYRDVILLASYPLGS